MRLEVRGYTYVSVCTGVTGIAGVVATNKRCFHGRACACHATSAPVRAPVPAKPHTVTAYYQPLLFEWAPCHAHSPHMSCVGEGLGWQQRPIQPTNRRRARQTGKGKCRTNSRVYHTHTHTMAHQHVLSLVLEGMFY